jgi:predicted ester cyclase
MILFFFILQFTLTVMLGLVTEVNSLHRTLQMSTTHNSEQIVRDFLLTVRSGKNPDLAKDFMAGKVLAHQMNSEHPQTVERTPENYAAHVKEFLEMYGQFEFEITELIAQDHKVYARWKQTGKHLTEVDGYPPTGLPLIEIASAVYRLENGKIVEYWIQIDRAGFDKQLQQGRK